jgi:hypothetical protein
MFPLTAGVNAWAREKEFVATWPREVDFIVTSFALRVRQESMMRKHQITEILDEFPEEVDLKDFFYRLRLTERIETAERQFAAGETYSREEVKQMLKECL